MSYSLFHVAVFQKLLQQNSLRIPCLPTLSAVIDWLQQRMVMHTLYISIYYWNPHPKYPTLIVKERTYPEILWFLFNFTHIIESFSLYNQEMQLSFIKKVQFITETLTSPSSNGELILLVQLRTMLLIVNRDDPRLKLRDMLQLVQKENVKSHLTDTPTVLTL